MSDRVMKMEDWLKGLASETSWSSAVLPLVANSAGELKKVASWSTLLSWLCRSVAHTGDVDILTAGIYHVSTQSSTAGTFPSGSDWGYALLIVLDYNGDIFQILITLSGKLAIRGHNVSGFRTWRVI